MRRLLALAVLLLLPAQAWAAYECLTSPNAAAVAFAPQARVFEQTWQTFALGIRGTGVIYAAGACQVTQRAAGANMSVDVTNGCTISVVGVTQAVTSGNLVIGAADSTNPRFDLVGATSAGVKTVTPGTPAASPLPPTIPDAHVPLAWVFVPAGDTAIQSNQITDARPCIPTPGGGGGSGTVTNTGTLTANALLIGNGGVDTKVVAGLTTNGTSKITLGVAGTSVGSVDFKNATSGTITVSPPTGALGTVTVSLPAATDTLVGKATTDTLTNKTYDTAGAGNAFAINGVAATANTGTGAVARAAGPTFTTPTLGVATATSVNKMAITAPATSSTLAVADGKTFTASNTITVAGTDGTMITFQATDTYVGRATTDTLTNKTLDAEGTGNVLKLPLKIWAPAAGCDNATAGTVFDQPTSNGGVAACYGTSPMRVGALNYADGASALTSQVSLHLPSDWDSAQAVDVKFVWFSGSTSTNSVVWTLQTVCIADTEDVLAPTFNAAQTVTDANLATANTRNSASITSVTMTGCAAGELLFLRVGRDPTNGSDTLAATAALIGIEITLRRSI